MSDDALPPLGVALAVLALALLASLLPRGLPPGADGVRAWDGLGPHVDVRLPDHGRVVLERVRVDDGRETLITASSQLGGELISVLLYALAAPAAWLWLRRRAPLRLRLDGGDLDRLLTALAVLVPAYAVLGALAGVWAAQTDGGVPLLRAVYRFCLPSLVHPETAWVPILRMVVLAPLAEELIWRGIVFRGLRTRLRFGPASLLAAFAFGLWHLLSGWTEPGALASQYVFGLVAAWLVERGGSLGGAIALHALGNAATLGLYATTMLAPERVLALFGIS